MMRVVKATNIATTSTLLFLSAIAVASAWSKASAIPYMGMMQTVMPSLSIYASAGALKYGRLSLTMRMTNSMSTNKKPITNGKVSYHCALSVVSKDVSDPMEKISRRERPPRHSRHCSKIWVRTFQQPR